MKILVFTLAFTCVSGLFGATVSLTNLDASNNGGYAIRGAGAASADFVTTAAGYKGVMGRFTITDSAITTAFSSGDMAAINTGFSAFGSTFVIDNLVDGVFSTSQSADTKAPSAFGSATIYTVFFKGASLASATELLIAKLDAAFPTDPDIGGALSSDVFFRPSGGSGISSIVVGGNGSNFDFAGGSGSQITYQLSLVGAAPEPSRAMLAGLGLMGLVIRRRRK